MTNTEWESETIELLQAEEAERHKAEVALETVQQTIQAKDKHIAALRLSLALYRKKCGLPDVPIPSPVAETEYGGLGPTAAVAKWAGRQNGQVVLKELAKALLATGMYKNYNKAYNAAYSVVKRRPEYKKEQEGIFQLRSVG